MAIGMGDSRERIRGMMIEVSGRLQHGREVLKGILAYGKQKMIQPVGKPPEVQD